MSRDYRDYPPPPRRNDRYDYRDDRDLRGPPRNSRNDRYDSYQEDDLDNYRPANHEEILARVMREEGVAPSRGSRQPPPRLSDRAYDDREYDNRGPYSGDYDRRPSYDRGYDDRGSYDRDYDSRRSDRREYDDRDYNRGYDNRQPNRREYDDRVDNRGYDQRHYRPDERPDDRRQYSEGRPASRERDFQSSNHRPPQQSSGSGREARRNILLPVGVARPNLNVGRKNEKPAGTPQPAATPESREPPVEVSGASNQVWTYTPVREQVAPQAQTPIKETPVQRPAPPTTDENRNTRRDDNTNRDHRDQRENRDDRSGRSGHSGRGDNRGGRGGRGGRGNNRGGRQAASRPDFNSLLEDPVYETPHPQAAEFKSSAKTKDEAMLEHFRALHISEDSGLESLRLRDMHIWGDRTKNFLDEHMKHYEPRDELDVYHREKDWFEKNDFWHQCAMCVALDKLCSHGIPCWGAIKRGGVGYVSSCDSYKGKTNTCKYRKCNQLHGFRLFDKVKDHFSSKGCAVEDANKLTSKWFDLHMWYMDPEAYHKDFTTNVRTGYALPPIGSALPEGKSTNPKADHGLSLQDQKKLPKWLEGLNNLKEYNSKYGEQAKRDAHLKALNSNYDFFDAAMSRPTLPATGLKLPPSECPPGMTPMQLYTQSRAEYEQRERAWEEREWKQRMDHQGVSEAVGMGPTHPDTDNDTEEPSDEIKKSETHSADDPTSKAKTSDDNTSSKDKPNAGNGSDKPPSSSSSTPAAPKPPAQGRAPRVTLPESQIGLLRAQANTNLPGAIGGFNRLALHNAAEQERLKTMGPQPHDGSSSARAQNFTGTEVFRQTAKRDSCFDPVRVEKIETTAITSGAEPTPQPPPSEDPQPQKESWDEEVERVMPAQK